MQFNQDRQGEFFILLGAVFWGLFPVLTILSFNHILPLASLAWSTLFSAMSFAIVLSIRGNWKEVKNFDALKDILWVTFFLSILYYSFYFSGLRYTSAGNSSIVALTEVFFSFLFFHLWRKDYISWQHITGSILMLSGAVIVLSPNLTGFRIGDLLILSAAFVAPFGNFFQQRARKQVSSETILFMRNIIATPIFFIAAYSLHQSASTFDLKQSLFFIFLNGFILLGFSKILWIEGIHRISVTKSNALSSISPLVTLFFAWLFLHNIPTKLQIFSVIPMIFGVILLGMNKKKEELENNGI